MNELPRQKLQEIITKYGLSLCDDSRRCEGLLKDLCGAYRGEIFLLIAALKEGIASDLLKLTSNTNNKVLKEVLLAKLVKRLQNNLGLTEKSAIWAVDSWAIALGITSQPLAKSSESGKDYESKLQQYELEFLRAIQKEYPISKNIDGSLNNLCQSLGLKKEDVQKITSSIISQKERENKKQKTKISTLQNKLQNSQKVVMGTQELNRILKQKKSDSQRKYSSLTAFLMIVLAGLGGIFSYHQSQEIESLKLSLETSNFTITKRDVAIADFKNKNKQLNQQILACELKAEKLPEEILPTPENLPPDEPFPWEHF